VANSKGTNILSMRKLLGQAGQVKEQLFLSSLTPEERVAHDQTLAMGWVPVAMVDALFRKTAAALFPGDPAGLDRVGRAIAHDNLGGIYRLLLKFTTLQFVVGQVARLWGTYNDTGQVRVDWHEKAGRGVLTLTGYPGFPEGYRLETGGFMAGTAEMCGAQDVRVQSDCPEPDTVRWTLTWKV
jgi:hypothetical protein